MIRAMKRIVCLIALALIAGALSGCIETDIPPAGSYSDVLLVTEEGARDPLVSTILPELAREIDYYVSRDLQFNVKFARADNLEAVPYIKNVVWCGVAEPTSFIGRDIVSMLGETGMARVRSGGHIFKKDDLPGPGQLTLIITGESTEDLIAAIDDRGEEIRTTIEESCRRRIRGYLLKNRNETLTRRLRQQYGFVIQVPTLYTLFSEESNPPGIELLRNGPSRSLGIFWLDCKKAPTLNDRQKLFDVRADYVAVRYDGDTMDSTRVTFEEDQLGEHKLSGRRVLQDPFHLQRGGRAAVGGRHAGLCARSSQAPFVS
jgi:hypothetical protein